MPEYKLYTKQDCAPCSSLKARLEVLGLMEYVSILDTHESVHRNAIIDMGFRSVPVLVCVDYSYEDGLPFVLNSLVGNESKDQCLIDFFKGAEV